MREEIFAFSFLTSDIMKAPPPAAAQVSNYSKVITGPILMRAVFPPPRPCPLVGSPNWTRPLAVTFSS